MSAVTVNTSLAHLAAVAKAFNLTPTVTSRTARVTRKVLPDLTLVYVAPVRMGDIGEPVRHIEFEPFPTTAPAEPSVAPIPEEVPA